MLGLIDIHCHLVPGVDDGARSMADALDILGDEKKNGVTEIIITPHFRREMFEADRKVVHRRFQELAKEAAERYPEIKLYLGCEFHANMEMENLVAAEPLYRMAGTEYILLEFSSAHDSGFIRERTYELLSRGYQPILAHVERYPCLARKMETVRELREMGASVQVNADAILGIDGWGFRSFTRKLLKNNLIDFIGSDAHNMTDRSCHLARAYSFVAGKIGTDEADRIFIDNPEKIIKAASSFVK